MPDFWNDPNSAWTHDWNNAAKTAKSMLGITHEEMDPSALGGHTDNTQADEERARMAPLLAQLQNQASTGGGPWEQALKTSTQAAGNDAQAMGQSNPNVGYSTALRNTGNAQAAIGQQAAGQENVLRAQSRQAGATGAADLLSGMSSQDASQAANEAGVAQSVREANIASGKAAQDRAAGAWKAIPILGSLSKGGPVPGEPKVFGDNEKNDTVPAMLSPGEIVVPRSHADSPEHAADFVRALYAKKGVQHFADGNFTGIPDGYTQNPATGQWSKPVSQGYVPGGGGGSVTNMGDAAGIQTRYGGAGGQEAPTIENGGLLNTGQYNATRAAGAANANLMAQQAAGNGPSVAGQQAQNARDANIAAAMGSRGGASTSGSQLASLAAAQQGAAGNAAETVGSEAQKGQQGAARQMLGQRANDQAMAQAQQQAAFRNTMMNMGMDLASQAQIKGLLAGAGQGFQALSSSGRGGGGDTSSFGGSDKNTPEFDQGLNANEWDNPYADQGGGRGSAADISSGEDKWKGGRIGYSSGGSAGKPSYDFNVDEFTSPSSRAEFSSAMSDDYAGRGSASDLSENEYGERGSSSDLSEGDDKWKGGEIDSRAEDFVKALKRRRA